MVSRRSRCILSFLKLHIASFKFAGLISEIFTQNVKKLLNCSWVNHGFYTMQTKQCLVSFEVEQKFV